MLDALGRDVNYLRVSITQRCNLNCRYCGAACPDTDELDAETLQKIISAFAKAGINKVRLTGGEPLLRKDIVDIAARCKSIDGIDKLAITTNATRLADYAKDLKAAGVDDVNVSLDSLDRDNYQRMTGRDALDAVLEGIDAALSAGFRRVRINSVLIRGENDKEAEMLIGLAKDRTIDVRFIELMPFSEQGKNTELIVRADELLSRFPFLVPYEDHDKSVAKYYSAPGYQGKIGFIAPVSDQFCDRCNRIRLLCNGEIRPCLGHDRTFDLRPVLDDEQKMLEVIRQAIISKPAGHHFNCAYGNMHAMNKIGG